MKDLIRALRGDDSRCEIRRQLGLARVLQKVCEQHLHYSVDSLDSSPIDTIPYGKV